MKKIFLFAFVAFLFFTPVVSASASIAWTPDAISGLGDLGYSLIGGASFDFKNSKYIEGAVDVDNAIAERQAAQFLADYCLSRGIGLLNPDELPTSDYEYFKTYYFNSITNKAWNNYRLAQTQAEQDEALRFELSNSLFAQWAGYDKLWYKNYIENFSNSADDPFIIPSEYSYIEDTNILYIYDASGYNGKSIFNVDNIYIRNTLYQINSLSNYSFLGNFTGYINGLNRDYHNLDTSNRMPDLELQAYLPILTVNIDSLSNSSVNVLYSSSYSSSFIQNYNATTGRLYYYQNQYVWSDQNRTSSFFQSNFNNLTEALNYVYSHFFNINLIVNGDTWLSVDSAPANPVIPDFTDIIDKDSDNPAYDIVVPVDGVPAWFDLTSLFDAIKIAIIDAKNSASDTDGILNVDLVLDNDGVIDDTGEVVDTKDEAIDDVLDTPVEIDKTKDYPVIPLYTPPVQNAFKGTSILAELIDGTQTVLPEELILTFWGIVFVIFILGLLKILHK